MRVWPAALLGLLVVLAVMLSGVTFAHAHTRSVSYSWWQLEPQTTGPAQPTVRYNLKQLDLTALGSANVASRLSATVRLFVEGAACRPGPIDELSAQPGWRSFSWSFDCPAAGPGRSWRIENDVLFAAIPAHLHFARVERGPSSVGEHVLTEQQRAVELRAERPPPSWLRTLRRFVPLGIEHILSGWDHLVFLFALLLIARAKRSVIWLVTGFTAGHSVSLALAAMGQLRPHQPTVEALIGASVALVAVEAFWLANERRQPLIPQVAVLGLASCAVLAALRQTVAPLALAGVSLLAACYFLAVRQQANSLGPRFAITTLFGVVHGFGFAGVLGEMSLPTERLLPALFGFNIGVELGQLAVVAALMIVLILLSKRDAGLRDRFVELGATAATCAGVFWLLTRTFGM